MINKTKQVKVKQAVNYKCDSCGEVRKPITIASIRVYDNDERRFYEGDICVTCLYKAFGYARGEGFRGLTPYDVGS